MRGLVKKVLLIKQFIIQIRELYDNNPDNIIKCFMIYLGMLSELAKKEYTEFAQFQIDDMKMCLYNPNIDTSKMALEVALVYSRRGGKSRTLSIIGVFLDILELVVVWRSPYSSQLQQAELWFQMNPFVSKTSIPTKNSVSVYLSPDINISVLSPGKVASLDADILIYDEGGWVSKDAKLYEYYKASSPMIAASKNKHIIHTSTPARYTVIDDEYHNLKGLEEKYKTKFTSLHPWQDCYWITEEWIEQERDKNKDCPWYVEQNYECKWVTYGGTVFTNVIPLGDSNYPTFKKDYFIERKMNPTHAGVDFNGDINQHYIVSIKYDDNFVYVLKEEQFLDLHKLVDYPNHISLEVEDGIFNNKYTNQLKRMGLNCIYNINWTEDSKDLRMEELRKRTIIIDPLTCPTTYDNLLTAAFDPNSRVPHLEKRKDQHGLDSLLHAIHTNASGVYISQGNVNKKREIDIFENFSGNKYAAYHSL